jgi:hypothetical protein
MSTKKTATTRKAKAAKKPASKKPGAAAMDTKTTALIAMLTKGATAEHMANRSAGCRTPYAPR